MLINNYARLGVTFASGEGAWLTATDGTRYLDFLTGLGVNNVGHCHPRVVAAIAEQSARLLHVSNLFSTEPMERLAQRLAASSLGGAVMFANSGAEANEAAIKLARKARRGGEVLSLHQGFHGRTYGALSATPQESKQAPFAPLVPGFRAIPPVAEAIAAAVGPQTAALLVEPLQGESGVLPIAPEALRAARAACDEHGACLIFDEVQTGMGRTGTLWAYQQLGVTPDVMTVAKGLAGGLPIGAVIAAPGWADVYEPGDHGSTFAGGPVQCAAAHAVLDVLDDELLARVRELGERVRSGLAALPGVRRVEGLGLMIGADLSQNAPTVVRRALEDEQLIVNATGPSRLRLLPPLTITDAEADAALSRLLRVLQDLSPSG